MLTSHRFTLTVTKDTADRLELAATNERPIARRESHRGAVCAIQSALADLNKGYLHGSDVDGYFGVMTANAVEAFQRDYGLYADGIVGRQTIMQLDGIYGPGVVRAPSGMSVHIGIDKVDTVHYGPGLATLSSCVNDARAMSSIADQLGYQSLLLENEDGTVGNFTTFMRHAASTLCAGDALLITFSGHGSQITDNGADAEADGLDETMCFFDRMLVDDEFYALLGALPEGVRVICCFDSCHSGTVAKQVDIPLGEETEQRRDQHMKSLSAASATFELAQAKAVSGGVPLSTVPLSSDQLAKELNGAADRPAGPAVVPADELAEAGPAKSETLDLLADLYALGTTGPGKVIDMQSGPYDKHTDLYDAVRDAAGPKGLVEVQASVVTLSACDDAQTTPAGLVYSLFTSNILAVWSSGSFSGNYDKFMTALRARSRADATPVLNTYGQSTGGLVSSRPFVL